MAYTLEEAPPELLPPDESDAASAGAGFVEIQHTMLFAAVGQKA